MTPTNDQRKALSSLDILYLRSRSHAEKSNSPQDMLNWIKKDFEIVKAALNADAITADDHCEECDRRYDVLVERRKEVASLERRIGALRKALEYYAKNVYSPVARAALEADDKANANPQAFQDLPG